MDGKSLTPEQEKINALRQVLPEAFSEGKIDWEKLKATLGEDINFSNERYVLNWAGKSEAFKVLQTPTTKTLVPAKDESVNFDETENIFIEGENLEALKVLQKSYFGKVKMIYIDPPYNTGNDSFIYPDKFSESKADYEKRVGDKDEEGYMTKSSIKFPSLGGLPQAGWSKNSKENGQYHSNWLNMMMPRLYLAKNLLRQDGVIFVSIDDNEVHNLRLLMNEIFGEENFVAQITRATGTPTGGGGAKPIVNEMDYLLVYSKSPNLKFTGTSLTEEESTIYDKEDENGIYLIRPLRRTGGEDRREDRPTMYYPLISPDGTEVYPIAPTGYESRWICGKDKFDELNNANLIEWKQNGNNEWTVYQKFYLEGRLKQPGNLWTKVEGNKKATRDVRDLFQGKKIFDFPKPVGFISKILQISTDSNDLILDFFAGSASTAHAVMNINIEEKTIRKYICVQLPELADENSEAYKAGYKTIAEISKERIRRAGKKIQEEIKAEIAKIETEIKKLEGELPTDETKAEIENLKIKIEKLQSQDLGFKVLKLADSNFKQWQQLPSVGGVSEGRGGKEEQAKATRTELAEVLQEQMKLFVDPVSESATIENMVYELLLKSGKDLNAKIFPSFGGVAESQGGKFPSFGGVPNGRGGRNSKNYFDLPYNPKLKERARELRQAGNLSEVLFWNQVKNKQFKGFDFDRQKIIGNYIVDFYCSNCNVVIEIDGSSHDDKVEYDAERDAYLESLGLTVIHIPVAEVMKNMNKVMQILFDHPALKGTPPKEGNLKPDYYKINGNELILLLEKATQEIIDAVIAEKPIKVIALDKLFKGNDQLKTNTVLQMKDAGVEFKTI
ncbi:MAG: DUF559 domain-containing protein [Paludibacter sp.]